MRYLLLTILVFCAKISMGQSLTKPSTKLNASDSMFIKNIVLAEKPISYTAIKTKENIVMVLVFADSTLVYTLNEDFVEDIIELVDGKIIVYPKEFD